VVKGLVAVYLHRGLYSGEMNGLRHGPLSPREERELNIQLAEFWYGCSDKERNEYANLLVFLMLHGETTIAPAALQIVIYDLITSGTFRLPWSPESEDEFRGSVAAAIIEKLQRSTSAKQWLTSYDQRETYGGNFYAWLKKVAYTTAIDLLRGHPMQVGSRSAAQWARHESLSDGDMDWPIGTDESTLIRRSGGVQSMRKLAKHLSQVPSEWWEAFLLRVDDGLSYSEIAERQKSTPEAVRKRISRVKARLKSLLD